MNVTHALSRHPLRRAFLASTVSVITIASLAGAGCQSNTGTYTGDRARRLIAMAGDEAGQVTSAKERLTRQLNIADAQTNQGRAADARLTLEAAGKTLFAATPVKAGTTKPSDDPNALDDQTRLAGWVSISELSRGTDDSHKANMAIDQAVTLLRQIEPATHRVKYVHSIGEELKALRGKSAAGGLLADAGKWAGDIDDMNRRRVALTSIASDLFANDAYDAGRDVLRHDPDAAWRSDTLARLAQEAAWQAESSQGGLRAVAVSKLAPASPSEASTGIAPVESIQDSVDLSYKKNFAPQQQSGSR